MKILFTGFNGFNNSSKEIIERIKDNKLLLDNSYKQIDKQLLEVDLEGYDLIVMLEKQFKEKY